MLHTHIYDVWRTEHMRAEDNKLYMWLRSADSSRIS